MLRALLIVLLVMLFIGMLPFWPYSATWGWGYYPSFGMLVLLAVVLLFFTGIRRDQII